MKETMIDKLGKEWYEFLGEEFDKSYMQKLYDFVKQRRKDTIVYPSAGNVFNAYKLTPYNNVKVCIIGQDPYINPGEAHGLAFSTENNRYTPTLRQLEKAITRDIHDKEPIWTNNLERWTKQGVFLLNTSLTVDAGKSNSHKGIGWEIFTSKTIQFLNRKEGVVFMLWGKDATIFEQYINTSKNLVIKCEHPVAASYQNRDWINNNCFNIANNYINNKGETIIKW